MEIDEFQNGVLVRLQHCADARNLRHPQRWDPEDREGREREGRMEKTQEQKKMLPGSLVRPRKTGRVRPLARIRPHVGTDTCGVPGDTFGLIRRALS